MKTVDVQKLRARRIVATAVLTAVAVAFLLLEETSAPVSAMPAAAVAEQTPAGPISISLEPLVLYQTREAPPADQKTALEMAPPEPRAAPQRDVPSGWDDSPIGRQQRTFKSRRALETVDAREYLRMAR